MAHQVIVTMTTSNTTTIASEADASDSYDVENFQSEMETRREWKQKVCERSNKAGREIWMERVVYFV